ncbi:MAG: hypothetical protein HY221_02725 [Candidatus Sungbacteria bacterium]|uniref:Uncharacterized protein n=1 Tax=Candidatus Sungiibacteriota bacterium TaxID=2750080 RepID=A0A932VRG5_9BACT|nr:hypothetical protein [Candidatus Sungbacteria bacterium]
MTFFRRKKILSSIGISFFIAAVFYLYANISLAANSPTASTFGNAAASGLARGIDFAGVVLIVHAILAILYSVLTAGLGIVGFLLDNAFSWNLLSNPSRILVIQQGWGIMRDLTNGLFLFVILWIALTYILNIENLGGKRLLVRVIVVALLVNFSLTMVSAMFGFTNELAKPFYTAMKLNLNNPSSSLSAILISNSHIYEVADNSATQGALDQFKKTVVETSAIDTGNSDRLAWLSNAVGVPQSAHAQWLEIAKYFGVQILGQLAGNLLGALVAGSIAAASWQSILNLAIANVFFILMIVAMFTAFLVLALRLVAMVFVSIFAPVAFASQVIPKYGERFWHGWLGYLFNWAFVAPVFYFLIYISLLFLQGLTIIGPVASRDIPFTGNVIKMLNFVLFLVLFFTALRITKKMGGAVAETALNVSKKVAGIGLGLTTGGLALGASSIARRYAPALKKALNIPVLRQTMIARRAGAYLERQKERVAPHERELGEFSNDYLVQEFDRSIRAERKVAIANLLAKRGKFAELGDRQEKALDLAGQFGPQTVENLLKARPDLANANRVSAADVDKQLTRMGFVTPQEKAGAGQDIKDKAARRAILSKIKTSEAADISDDVFEKPEMVKEMWEVFSPAHIAKIASDKPAMLAEMKRALETRPDIEITPEMYRYLGTTTAQALGLSLPTSIKRPLSTVQGEVREEEQSLRAKRQEIDALSEEADMFRTRGQADEADRRVADAKKILEVDIPKIDLSIQRLNQEVAEIERQRSTVRGATAGPAPTRGPGPGPAAAPPPPGAGTVADPLGPRDSITAAQIPDSWVDDAWRNLQGGGGTTSQKIIFESRGSESEKRRELREELARGYKTGRY